MASAHTRSMSGATARAPLWIGWGAGDRWLDARCDCGPADDTAGMSASTASERSAVSRMARRV